MGRITSIETMGLVDGPGIRAVVFFAGCGIRCAFCHNPESWCTSGGEETDAESLVRRLVRLKPYFNKSGGGVTLSGGEPLLQPKFLCELLGLLRREGVHTCLDTAGVGLGEYDEILSLVDLVLYDVKAIDAESYKKMTGADIEKTELFMRALRKSGVPVVVRQVVIPDINDSDGYMVRLREYIEKNLPNATGVELLPYHTLGAHKYRALGIPEPLSGVAPMSAERTAELWQRHFSDFGNALEREQGKEDI